MNHDNPKLTAYALDSLPTSERAEIEALLKEQPSAATEVAETREMAGIMRQLFSAELTETLTPRRREAILEAAAGRRVLLSTEVSTEAPGNGAAPANEVAPANVVTVPVSWWRRVGAWQAAAACAVFAFGVYAISVTLTKSNPSGGYADRRNSDVQVHIGGLTASADTPAPHQPGIGSPLESTPVQPNAVAGLPNGQNGQKAPGITTQPNDFAGMLPDAPLLASKPQKPTMVGGPKAGNQNFPSANASVGKAEKRHPAVVGPAIADTARLNQSAIGVIHPGERLMLPTDNGEIAVTGEEVGRYNVMREYLSARWLEANSIRENSTYEDLSRLFRRDGGSTTSESYRFVMIKCPFIKVDVQFATEDGKPATWPVSGDTRIRAISRPVFEPEHGK